MKTEMGTLGLGGARLWLGMIAAMGACRSDARPPSQAQTAGIPSAGTIVSAGSPGSGGAEASGMSMSSEAGQAAAGGEQGGSTAAGCAGAEATELLGLASAPLRAAPPLQLSAGVELLGDGLASTLMTQQVGAAGLRWQGDRMLLLTDTGFWDIPVAGPARWYPTSTVTVLGIRAADVDGDGDQDIMLLSSQLNIDAGMASSTALPIVARLTVWERTPEGLVERSELTRRPSFILPFPYVFGDVDGDGDLDVVSFEQGAPVGYVNDGAFTFTRKLLGETSPDYMDKLVALVDYADRNQDGAPDLLVIAGQALEAQLMNETASCAPSC